VGAQKFECRDGDFIGREGTVGCQVFSGIGTVSRRHVSLSLRDGQWFLTALAGVQNITQLDGRELPRGVPQPLTGEHMLKMSTQCEVRLKVSEASL
jgi:predicted component of type VI protein secretion system